jgi:hypothetical protein
MSVASVAKTFPREGPAPVARPGRSAATHDARRRQILWLIQHHPESDLAGTSEGTIDPAGHALADPEDYRSGGRPG